MSLKVIIDENVMSDMEKIYVNKNIIKNRFFPMFYSNSTSTTFPFFSHVLMERNDPNSEDNVSPRSDLYGFFYPIFQRFCDRNKIIHKRVLRASINATYAIPGYKVSDPHVDYNIPHGVFILYLNNLPKEDGCNSTLIYNQRYTEETGSRIEIAKVGNDFVDQMQVEHKIEPRQGKAMCFSGEYYHTLQFPKPSETRYVCVFNFL